jgi:hypothetical protein
MPRPKKEGGPNVHLTLRIPPDLHKRLTAGAGERGIAEEIRQRLEQSFSVGDDTKTRELLGATANLARSIKMYYANWHADPFSYRAFKFALDKVLAYYQPQGEAVPKPNPNGIAQLLYEDDVTPEEFGRNMAALALGELREGKI